MVYVGRSKIKIDVLIAKNNDKNCIQNKKVTGSTKKLIKYA
jgi:hypothetical protein